MNPIRKTLIGSVLGLGILGGTLTGAAAADPIATPTNPTPGVSQRGPIGNGARGMGLMESRGFGVGVVSVDVAKLLGLSEDQIQDKRQDGQSLAEIAAEKGVTKEQLTQTMLVSKKSNLQERVSTGAITQAQADEAYARMQTQTLSGVERTTVGPNRPADAPRLGLNQGAQAKAGTQNGLRDGTGTGVAPRDGTGAGAGSGLGLRDGSETGLGSRWAR